MKRLQDSITPYLRAPLAPEHRFASGLLAFMMLRWLMALLLVLDVLHLKGHVPPWYFHTGGDQQYYYRLAEALARGQIATEIVGVGAPLVMVPFVWLVDAFHYRDIVAPLVVINGFLLGGLSIVLTGLIGKIYSGDERAGLLGAGLWLLAPVFFYGAVGFHPAAASLRGTGLPKIMWLTGISDGPSIFAMLVAVWLLGRALERRSLRAFFGAGLALGWAVMIRIQVSPIVAALLGILVVARVWRGLLWVCIGGLVGYFPQAVLNTVEFGIPFYTGYLRANDPTDISPTLRRPLSELRVSLRYSPSGFVQSVAHLRERLPFVVPLALVAGVAGIILLVVLWRRRGWLYAAILLGVPLVNIAVHLALPFFALDPVRFTMLSYPYLFVAGAYFLFVLWDARPARLFKTRRVEGARRERPRDAGLIN